MGKFYWNIRRTHRTSMKFSVALSLTLVFLATVFATPKPKTYLVETADPELDAWSFEDPFYRRAGADYYGKPKPVEYKPVEKYEVETVEYKTVEKYEAAPVEYKSVEKYEAAPGEYKSVEKYEVEPVEKYEAAPVEYKSAEKY